MAGAIIIGAGPGIATSVARRFGGAGMRIGLVSRSEQSIAGVRAALARDRIESAGATADAARERELKAALDKLVAEIGVPEVLVYNAGLIQQDRPGELSHERHLAAYGINVLGALTAVSHLAPAMSGRGGGTVILTGGMLKPEPSLVSLSLGKAGVRALTTLLAKEYGPGGLHVATVTVCGAVSPGGEFDPDRIAERYWALHAQAPGLWEREVVFEGQPAAR